MAANRSERLMNLMILLLMSRTYLPKSRIREAIGDYRDSASEAAFERMFDRDKETLRTLGVPIETGSFDAWFDDDLGYRINRDAYELPELDLEPDEAAVVGVAARVWQHAGLADATSQALLKLKAAGVEVDREAIDVVGPQLRADDPGFDALWQATRSHTPVRFDYRRSDAATSHTRHLQPWGMVSGKGRWYVVGLDTDRQAPRMFRLSRITGAVVLDGEPGAFEVPEGTDVRELARVLAPAPPATQLTATLRVRRGAGGDLRRSAVSVSPDGDGWDLVEVPYAEQDGLADEVLAALDAVQVVAPEQVRHQVIARLRALAFEGHSAPEQAGSR